MVSYYPLSAFGRESRCRFHRHSVACVSSFYACRSFASRLGHRARRQRKRQAQTRRFNREFDRRIVWVPWQRPGFELALLIEKAVKDNPGVEGLILGGHGLFTWGMTQRECYLNSIRTIDQMGEFIQAHQAKKTFPVWRDRACAGARPQNYRY